MLKLRFKNEFYGVENALRQIPEYCKEDNFVFEITDGNETYRLRWIGSGDEGEAEVISQTNDTEIPGSEVIPDTEIESNYTDNQPFINDSELTNDLDDDNSRLNGSSGTDLITEVGANDELVISEKTVSDDNFQIDETINEKQEIAIDITQISVEEDVDSVFETGLENNPVFDDTIAIESVENLYADLDEQDKSATNEEPQEARNSETSGDTESDVDAQVDAALFNRVNENIELVNSSLELSNEITNPDEEINRENKESDLNRNFQTDQVREVPTQGSQETKSELDKGEEIIRENEEMAAEDTLAPNPISGNYTWLIEDKTQEKSKEPNETYEKVQQSGGNATDAHASLLPNTYTKPKKSKRIVTLLIFIFGGIAVSTLVYLFFIRDNSNGVSKILVDEGSVHDTSAIAELPNIQGSNEIAVVTITNLPEHNATDPESKLVVPDSSIRIEKVHDESLKKTGELNSKISDLNKAGDKSVVLNYVTMQQIKNDLYRKRLCEGLYFTGEDQKLILLGGLPDKLSQQKMDLFEGFAVRVMVKEQAEAKSCTVELFYKKKVGKFDLTTYAEK